MELNTYIRHPELLDRDTLYSLRSFVALYPYHQAARLLMLQNLYLLHDPTFDEELRQAAFRLTDRTALFNLVEARHYKLPREEQKATGTDTDRTGSLIDSFLSTRPEATEEPKRKPTAADATVDYVSYMLAMGSGVGQDKTEEKNDAAPSVIDTFLENDGGKIRLPEKPVETEDAPHNEVTLENDRDDLQADYYTETLAKIYIKQGKHSKALEIISQLNLNNSGKNAYFADQMRFLEKIIAVSDSRKGKNT